MGDERFSAQRAAALAGTSGRVLELGFGAGHNLPHYPDAVREVLALEPATVNRKLARRRIERSAIPVSWIGLRGEQIPLDADSVDAVASTWTLCSVADVGAALAEVRRVLRPGGGLHFVEHGLAPDPGVARWQRRLNGLQKACAGGCHLDRAFDELLRAAGFELWTLEMYYIAGPRIFSFLYRGVAAPASSGAAA